MNRPTSFLLCIAPQFLVIAALVAREEIAITSGVEIELEVGAIDPMNWLAGRYVSTPLRIAILDPKTIEIPAELQRDRDVYVRLEKSGDVWAAAELLLEPPQDEGIVFLDGRWLGDDHGLGNNRVDYGLDRFFIPENGEDPSVLAHASSASGRLHVKARVTRTGHAVLTDLLIDGKSYVEWNAAEKARKQ